MKRGWKAGESQEIKVLGDKGDSKESPIISALLRVKADLRSISDKAQKWPDGKLLYVSTDLMQALSPVLIAMGDALDGKPENLERIIDQIVSVGHRIKRKSFELNPVTGALLNPCNGVIWEHSPEGSRTQTGLAELFGIITKAGVVISKQALGRMLKKLRFIHGSKVPESLTKPRKNNKKRRRVI